MISCLLGTHLFFTFKLKGIQFKLLNQFKALFSHKNHDTGEITQFSSLMSILASTMGTGNIIGVATAILLGGPGSIFWMIVAGILGMATKYAETWIAVKHRISYPDGTFLGGTMVILKKNHPFVSALFCLVGSASALTMGCTIQSNAAALMLKNMLNVPLTYTAVLFSVLTSFVILKGMKSISSFCTFLIPIVSTIYLCTCLSLLIINHQYILPSILLIFKTAFSPQSISSGFMGFSLLNSIRYGISRGLFTNESGMGSTPIISASSICSDPKDPSYTAMFSVFLDTVIVCTITGLVFISCSLRFPALALIYNTEDFSLACFSLLPHFGKLILCFSIVLFALSTIFGWCIIGEKLLQFLFGSYAKHPYRMIWILSVFAGCICQLDTVWMFSDLFNALMCLPNLFMLYLHHNEISL